MKTFVSCILFLLVSSSVYPQHLPQLKLNQRSSIERDNKLSLTGLIVVTDICHIDTYSLNSIKNAKIIEVDDSTYDIAKDDIVKTLSIGDMRKLTFPKHGFWKGFLWGSLVTAGLALGITAIVSPGLHGEDQLGAAILLFGGLALSIPVGLVTGCISEFATTDDIFYFEKGISSVKVNKLKYIVLQHKE